MSNKRKRPGAGGTRAKEVVTNVDNGSTVANRARKVNSAPPPHEGRFAGTYGLTTVQKLEVRRLAPGMRALLRLAGEMHPAPAEVSGTGLRSALILQRRGFVAVTREGGSWCVWLTIAGHAALAMLAARRRP